MKSGTTFFTQLLAGHPQIFMYAPKEPCYFGDPEHFDMLRWVGGSFDPTAFDILDGNDRLVLIKT